MFKDVTFQSSERLAALVMAMLISTAPLAAQASRATLLLGDLYRDVQVASPKIAAARALAQSAEARVSSAQVPPDPQVQIGIMNYTVPGLRPMDPLGMAQIQVMQMLPVAGKLALAGRVRRHEALAHRERAVDVAWEIRGQAAMAFYDLYQIDQSVVVARETLRLLQDLQRSAQSMYRVGEGRQADVLRANVEIARMVEDTLRMQTMRTSMAFRLNALLDRSPNAHVGAPLLPVLPESLPMLLALVDGAERNRPMVKASEREVQAAEAASKLARREFWPDLTLGVQYGQRSAGMRTERMGSLMLGASLPVFASRRQLSMRDEADAMQAMARADLAMMRAETRGRVAEAYANLTQARSLVALYRSTILPQADATVMSSLSAYRVGSVDFMTALDSRMAANKFRQELFTLEAEEGKAWAELEMLLGRELFDPLTTRTITTGGAHERR